MIKRLALALAAACLSLLSVALDFTDYARGQVAGYARTALTRVTSFAVKVVAGPVALRTPNIDASTELAAADSFWLRLVKRERPVISASWRMCPST